MACENSSTDSGNSNTKTSEVSDKKTSIIGKWYYNSEDDRYYYQFFSDGKVNYSYYQNIGSQSSILNSFIIVEGHWSYLNDEKNKFTVGWKDSIDCWYDIISEDAEKLVVTKDSSGPVGRGLGSVTNLLKSAKTVVYTVDEEILDLIGTWYYDSTKEGKYLSFQKDGICYYHYYQYYGTGSFSSFNAWVSQKGIWNYSSSSKTLTVTMNGEVSYHYEIVSLNSLNLQIKMKENNPTGSSMIYSNSMLYK